MSDHVSRGFPVVSDERLLLIDRLGLTDYDEHVDHLISKPAAFGFSADWSIKYRFIGRTESDRPPLALLLLAAGRLALERE